LRTNGRPVGHSVASKSRLAATDRLIDLIVYRLDGLTEEEVAVVEGRSMIMKDATAGSQ